MLILPSGGSGRYYKIPPVIPGTFQFLFSGEEETRYQSVGYQ